MDAYNSISFTGQFYNCTQCFSVTVCRTVKEIYFMLTSHIDQQAIGINQCELLTNEINNECYFGADENCHVDLNTFNFSEQYKVQCPSNCISGGTSVDCNFDYYLKGFVSAEALSVCKYKNFNVCVLRS